MEKGKDLDNMRRIWDEIPAESVNCESGNQALVDVLLRTSDRGLRWKPVAFAACFALMLSLAVSAVLLKGAALGNRPVAMVQKYVPMGEISSVELPDGSKVCLNSGSTLIYPESFGARSRTVHLIGEAYFDVSKDSSRPFTVNTRDLSVLVTGTVFDVSAYPEKDNSYVVLEDGSVKVTGTDGVSVYLEPGQQALYSRSDGSFRMNTANVSDYTSWQHGGLYIRKASIRDIMDIVRNCYGVEVFCSDPDKFSNTCITAKFDAKLELEDFLTVIRKLVVGMDFEIRNDSVLIF